MASQRLRVFAGYAAILCIAGLAQAQPPQSTAVKNTRFDYAHLRSGSIKTQDGWNFADFAISLMNPNSVPLDVVMTLRSDDPHFQFRGGKIGTWSRTFHMAPLSVMTANIFGYPTLALLYLENFPVREGTNFTGSVELSAPLPFYSYSGHDFETQTAVDPDEVVAYDKAWDSWQNAVPVVWDTDLHVFLVPYTNFWHNEKSYPTGWHTELTVTNNSQSTATYHISHKPGYGGEQDPMLGCRVTKPFVEQNKSIVLAPGESLHTTLEDFYGWNKERTTAMEGWLTIQAEPESAASGTAVAVTVLPNPTGAQACVANAPTLPIFDVIADVPTAPLQGTVTLAADPLAGRGIEVSGVEFYLDGEVRGNAAKAPYAVALDTLPLKNGRHVLTVLARARNGEVALSSVVVVVSNRGQ
jgi:hypothetical protein